MQQSAMESPGSNSEQGSSARVIQETPNSHSDRSSVSYKDWKRPDGSVQSSSLPRGEQCPLQDGAQTVLQDCQAGLSQLRRRIYNCCPDLQVPSTSRLRHRA